MSTLTKEKVLEIEALAAKKRQSWRPDEYLSYRRLNGVSFHVSQSARAHGEDCNAKLFRSLMEVLRGQGWEVALDQRIVKHYRCLAKSHREGSKGSIRFKAEYYPAGLEIKFFPNYGGDNPNGPEYGFDHYERATYLDKKRLDQVMALLSDCMARRGFVDETEPEFKDPREEVEYKVRSCWHFKEHDVSSENRPDMSEYNSKDLDGKQLVNGMTRYFFGWNGELLRGVLYHHINNMWWVIASGQVHNVSTGDLFSYDPVRCARKYQSRHAVSRMRAKLEKAVKERDYKLADILTQKLWRVDGGQVGEDPYVLRKNGLYYRGGSSGYTNSLATAGLYTLAYAERHCRGCSGEVTFHKLADLTR